MIGVENEQMDIKLTIPGTPVSKGRPRIGKSGMYTPEKTVNYESLVKHCYVEQGEGRKLEGPLKMEVDLYFPIPKSYSQKQIELLKVQDMAHMKKPDASNCLKSIEDALNGFAYDDDCQIVEVHVTKKYTLEDPRAEVRIKELND